jgi:arylsulfatase A-like enzyme
VTDNTSTRTRCVTEYLRDRGFESAWFTAAAPDWDNQTFWLARWYDDHFFDRSRQTDLTMFRHAGRWMRDHFSGDRPFFAGMITKTNHWPFNPVDDMTGEERAATPRKIGTTMRYSDRAMAAFFDEIRDAPWFDRTIFVITADHGFNMGEQGFWRLRDPLIRPSTWVPMVIVGNHPELMALPRTTTHLTSHVDFAPTVLDLMGISAPNHFVGHSLLDPRFQENAYVYANHNRDMVLERGGRRAMLVPPGRSRRDGDQVFDSVVDFELEQALIGRDAARAMDESRRDAEPLWHLTMDAFGRDRIWPLPAN